MNTQKTTVVCVTSQLTCERLIRAARRIADLTNTRLLVISVMPENPSQDSLKSLEYLFNVSKDFNAQMDVVYNSDAFTTLCKYFRKNDAQNVVTGMPVGNSSVLEKLWEKFSSICFYAVDFSDMILEVHNQKLQMINADKVKV